MCTKYLSSLKVQENWLYVIRSDLKWAGAKKLFWCDFLVSVLLLVEISLQNHG